MIDKLKKYICLSCGWDQLDFKPYENYPENIIDTKALVPPYSKYWGAASYGVCDCCGYEFGQDDDPGTAEPLTFAQYREQWISEEGGQWLDESLRPDGWLLEEQLKNLDMACRTKLV